MKLKRGGGRIRLRVKGMDFNDVAVKINTWRKVIWLRNVVKIALVLSQILVISEEILYCDEFKRRYKSRFQ